MRVQFYNAIADIGKALWDNFDHKSYPFSQYTFLEALERSDENHGGACCTESGWQPHHLVIFDKDDVAIAGLPLYVKYHSFGEYIFDWAWADAYQRHGIEYYPKLLSAIPFTPCTGPRLLTKPGVDQDLVLAFALGAIETEQQRLGLSSSHILFTEQQTAEHIRSDQWLLRESTQYHWFNRHFLQPGESAYADFEDFLSSYKSRKRKALKKERAQICEQNIVIERLTGDAISKELWEQFYRFYQLTYAKRSGHGGYLPKHFFLAIGKTMPEQIMMSVAYDQSNGGQAIAAALFFTSEDTLFGRYWGCTQQTEFLHFELCYYQGIEFCIERGLTRFDAGAQGEHKIQRGFFPVKTYSNHTISHTQFSDAIARFIQEEALYNNAYIQETTQSLPYKSK